MSDLTIRQRCRDEAIAELNAAPPTGIPQATMRRYIPGQKITEPRIACFFGNEDPSRPLGAGGPLTKREFMLAVQCVVIVEDPKDADDTMEPLLAHIVKTLGATNLDKLATNVEEKGTTWAGSNDGAAFILAALTLWKITYQTLRNDLTKKQ